jgi:hypothetical protein
MSDWQMMRSRTGTIHVFRVGHERMLCGAQLKQGVPVRGGPSKSTTCGRCKREWARLRAPSRNAARRKAYDDAFKAYAEDQAAARSTGRERTQYVVQGKVTIHSFGAGVQQAPTLIVGGGDDGSAANRR